MAGDIAGKISLLEGAPWGASFFVGDLGLVKAGALVSLWMRGKGADAKFRLTSEKMRGAGEMLRVAFI